MARTRAQVLEAIEHAKKIFEERFGRIDYSVFLDVFGEEIRAQQKDLIKTIFFRNAHFSPSDSLLAVQELAPLLTDQYVNFSGIQDNKIIEVEKKDGQKAKRRQARNFAGVEP